MKKISRNELSNIINKLDNLVVVSQSDIEKLAEQKAEEGELLDEVQDEIFSELDQVIRKDYFDLRNGKHIWR